MSARRLTQAQIDALPASPATLPKCMSSGGQPGVYTGPLLWAVLDFAQGIDLSKPKALARDTIAITGKDGYVAMLGLGEIAPQFEAKSVILPTGWMASCCLQAISGSCCRATAGRRAACATWCGSR